MAPKAAKKAAPDPQSGGSSSPDLLSLATSATMLWAESCYVIWARSWMIMAGSPGAARESRRMVAEKVEASHELMLQAMTGSLGSGMVAAQRSVDHFGRKVSANRRRLAKAK